MSTASALKPATTDAAATTAPSTPAPATQQTANGIAASASASAADSVAATPPPSQPTPRKRRRRKHTSSSSVTSSFATSSSPKRRSPMSSCTLDVKSPLSCTWTRQTMTFANVDGGGFDSCIWVPHARDDDALRAAAAARQQSKATAAAAVAAATSSSTSASSTSSTSTSSSLSPSPAFSSPPPIATACDAFGRPFTHFHRGSSISMLASSAPAMLSSSSSSSLSASSSSSSKSSRTQAPALLPLVQLQQELQSPSSLKNGGGNDNNCSSSSSSSRRRVRRRRDDFESSSSSSSTSIFDALNTDYGLADREEGDEIECPECGKLYTRPSAFRRHLQRHVGGNLLQCPWPDCAAQFPNALSQQQHLACHTSAYPFICCVSLCDAQGDHSSYPLLADLRAHVRNVHVQNGDVLAADVERYVAQSTRERAARGAADGAPLELLDGVVGLRNAGVDGDAVA